MIGNLIETLADMKLDLDVWLPMEALISNVYLCSPHCGLSVSVLNGWMFVVGSVDCLEMLHVGVRDVTALLTQLQYPCLVTIGRCTHTITSQHR